MPTKWFKHIYVLHVQHVVTQLILIAGTFAVMKAWNEATPEIFQVVRNISQDFASIKTYLCSVPITPTPSFC